LLDREREKSLLKEGPATKTHGGGLGKLRSQHLRCSHYGPGLHGDVAGKPWAPIKPFSTGALSVQVTAATYEAQ